MITLNNLVNTKPIDVFEKFDHVPTKKELTAWKGELRSKLYAMNKGRSYISGHVLHGKYDMHEGIVPRYIVPKNVNWHWQLFTGVNCMLIEHDWHMDRPPNRIISYWMAVARYGKEVVDTWVDSLPFKSRLSKPWIGTRGVDVFFMHGGDLGINHLQFKLFLNSVRDRIDFIA